MAEQILNIKFKAVYRDETEVGDFVSKLGDIQEQIKRLNPDLIENGDPSTYITYTYQTDPDKKHIFEGRLSVAPELQALFFQGNKFVYEVGSEAERALVSILNRIFWVPPLLPRISGEFKYTVTEYTLNGIPEDYCNPDQPGGPGIPGGGR